MCFDICLQFFLVSYFAKLSTYYYSFAARAHMIFLMPKLLYTPGVLQISSNSDYQWIFGGLKISFPGFFWVGKFGKYFVGLI